MHPEARRFISDQVTLRYRCVAGLRVLEIGSRDVNGSIRNLFPGTEYVGIDCVAGKAVDEVIDAKDYTAPEPFDVAITMEAMEHCPAPGVIIDCAARNLKPGGILMATLAAPDRVPHGIDGERPPAPGQWYSNVEVLDVIAYLAIAGLKLCDLEYHRERGDLYFVAAK